MAIIYTPSTDALATVDFLSGVAAPDCAAGGTLDARNYWSWDAAISGRIVYDGAGWAHKWGGGAAGSTGGDVSFAFDPGSRFTPAETGIVTATLALWSAVANVGFVEVAGATSDIAFYKYGSTDHSGLSASTYTEYTAAAGHYGDTTVPRVTQALTSFDTGTLYWSRLDSFTAFGGYGVDTVVHEIGHMLGLGHAGPYNGGVDTGTQQYNATDSRQWSVMSYIDPGVPAQYSAGYAYPAADWGHGPDRFAREPTTWMPLDILAAQRLYGMPVNTPLSGGQVFGFNCNVAPAIHDFFDFTVNTAPVVTLWDAGSGNALDLSGFAGASVVDLNPGTFSSAAGMTDNIGIAYGTRIDRVVGSGDGLVATVNAEADTIQGTGGFNVAVFATAGGLYRAGPGADGAATVYSAAGVLDTLLSVQDLRFSGGDDTIVADAGEVDLSGGGNVLFLGPSFAQVNSAGADTVVAGPGGAFVTVTGDAGSLIFGSAGELSVTNGGGVDTVVGGSGGTFVQGGEGGVVVWGGGQLTYFGGDGASTVMGGAAGVVIRSNQGGGLFVGGRAGGNLIGAFQTGATLVGAAVGDQLIVANTGANVLVAGSGAETLWGGAAATGANSFWAGTGDDLLAGGGGANMFVAGTGNATLLAGDGGNVLAVFDGLAGGDVLVVDWTPASDRIDLERFGADAVARTLASAVVSGSDTVVTLPDATRIVFAGVTGLGAAWFA